MFVVVMCVRRTEKGILAFNNKGLPVNVLVLPTTLNGLSHIMIFWVRHVTALLIKLRRQYRLVIFRHYDFKFGILSRSE
jgi:hypothetical protein